MADRIKKYSSARKNGDSRNWKNKLPNVPCFVLGNGPSLNDFDVGILKPFFTIGINRAFYKIDPTLLMWQDASLWFSERKKITETKAIKISTMQGDPENRYYHYKIKAGTFSMPENISLLHGSGCTGPLAVQLAYLLGCNPIVLCGFDCKSRSNDTDFYGTNRFHTQNTYINCTNGLLWIKEEFAKSKTTVINCGDNDVLEKHDVHEVIKNIDTRHRKTREYFTQFLR